MKLYHISETKLDNTILTPKIPKNYLIDNGYEENKTPRVCFSTSIDGCLMGLSSNGKKFHVYVADGDYKTHKPSLKEVPDSNLTNEIWVLEDVKLKYIGMIHVSEALDKEYEYVYGKNKKAYLYKWNWKWIEKINESYINEGSREGELQIQKLLDRKSPEQIWLISDLHFHKLDQDEFGNQHEKSEKLIQEMISKQRKTVQSDDVFILLGDIAHRRNCHRFLDELTEEYKQLKGTKILVKGNHDILNDEYYYNMGFKYVVDSFTWKNYVFTHQPVPVEGYMINIHGHIHNEKTYINMNWKNHINVFCEYYNNYPVNLKQLLKKYSEGFYTGKTIYNPSYPYYYDSQTDIIKDYMIKSETAIMESFFTSTDNLEYNVDKWGTRNKILYITGLSGAGKTTLMNELYSKNNDVIPISIDNFLWCISDFNTYENISTKSYIDKEFTLKYLYENSSIIGKYDSSNYNQNDLKNEVNKFIDWIEDINRSYKKLVIVEGMQLFMYFDADYFKNKSLIVVNASVSKSLQQRMKRDASRNDISYVFKNLRKYYKDIMPYINYDKKLSSFKSNLESTLDYSDQLQLFMIENMKYEVKSLIENYYAGKRNKLDILYKISELSCKESNIETVIADELITSLKQVLDDDTMDIRDCITDLPSLTMGEMESMGVFANEYYNVPADNKELCEGVSTKDWFKEYKLFSNGFLTENMMSYSTKWVNKLNTLYLDFKQIKESGDIDRINARKQSILELGWNPEIDFTKKNRETVFNYMVENYKPKYTNSITDISTMLDFYKEPITEAAHSKQLYPVYILCTYTHTAFGNRIRKVTKWTYTHVAISLDSDMNNLYSFNADQSGFSLESIKRYNHEDDCIACVNVIFVDRERLLKIKSKLDSFLLNKKTSHYSYLNCITLLFNKVVELNNSMICSQFVDFLLKDIGADITNKNSALVTPNDYAKIDNPRVYKIYEGKISDYDGKKIQKAVDKLQRSAKPIVESYNLEQETLDMFTIEPLQEAKSFPIQFDKEGNLILKNLKHNKLDLNEEYWKSHKLLVNYEKNVEANEEAIKYELAKLWFLNNILEQKIYKAKVSEEEKKEYQKIRARVLNDFNKYIKLLHNFNFTEYYENSPFSDATIKIYNSTIKYTSKYFKDILKLL